MVAVELQTHSASVLMGERICLLFRANFCSRVCLARWVSAASGRLFIFGFRSSYHRLLFCFVSVFLFYYYYYCGWLSEAEVSALLLFFLLPPVSSPFCVRFPPQEERKKESESRRDLRARVWLPLTLRLRDDLFASSQGSLFP